MKLTGETEVLGEKSCPSVTLSTTDPTWTDAGRYFTTGPEGVLWVRAEKGTS
jgi:hypothetical protein